MTHVDLPADSRIDERSAKAEKWSVRRSAYFFLAISGVFWALFIYAFVV
jgi:hypothetical protein